MDAGPYATLVEELRGDARVRLVYRFGSRARGVAGPRSDVDVAVLLDAPPTWDEERALRGQLARIDRRVDLVVLNRAPPALRAEIVRSGDCLLARDPTEQAEFELVSLSRDLDFEPMRRVQDDYLRARIQERRGPQTPSAP